MSSVFSGLRNEFYNSTSFKEILSSKFLLTQSKNKYGYCFFIEAFVSHVIFLTLSLLYSTFTIDTTLFLKTFFLLSKIITGCTSNNKSSLSSTSGIFKTCQGSEMYFLNIETWKTSWILSKSRGNFKR